MNDSLILFALDFFSKQFACDSNALKRSTCPWIESKKRCISIQQNSRRLYRMEAVLWRIYFISPTGSLPYSPFAQSSWRHTPWFLQPCPSLWWSQFFLFPQGLQGLLPWLSGGTGSGWYSNCKTQELGMLSFGPEKSDCARLRFVRVNSYRSVSGVITRRGVLPRYS